MTSLNVLKTAKQTPDEIKKGRENDIIHEKEACECHLQKNGNKLAFIDLNFEDLKAAKLFLKPG